MSDLNNLKVLILGAGPATIGQSGECDEGAVEVSQALANAGCRIITLNSNPDAVLATDGAIETSHLAPLTAGGLINIISLEKPDALLPTFGGRNGLHLAVQLAREGVLSEHGVALWGLSASALEKVLDRDALKAALSEINLDTPPIFTLNSVEAAAEKAQQLGFPVVLRCGDPDLIPDGVLVYNRDELLEKTTPLTGEPGSTLSVEGSLAAWQQVEFEILRDHAGETKLAGVVEYIDTASVHPGDALGISPPQGLSNAIIQRLEGHALAIADHLNIIGSATVRFAHQGDRDAIRVLAVHPRHTRTSAQVTRSANTSIASLSGLLAAGLTWHELPEKMNRPGQKAEGPPTVAVKWPRWSFDCLEKTSDRLGPQMQAVGQSIGYSVGFKEALQKAARGATGNDFGMASGSCYLAHIPLEDLLARLSAPASDRMFLVFEALRRGTPAPKLADLTHIAPWFLSQLNELVDTHEKICAHQGKEVPETLLRQAKTHGYSNAYLTHHLDLSIEVLTEKMAQHHIRLGWATFSPSDADRRFSTYAEIKTTAPDAKAKCILILGSGPHSIGQGPECDYGIFQAARTTQSLGYAPILLNCNLTSVSTGPAMNMPCYCDPISAEEVLAVIHREKPVGIITHYAGALSSGLMAQLAASQAPILGTPLTSVAMVRDRATFHERMRGIGIPQPMAGRAVSLEEAHALASKIDFPLSVQSIGPKACKDVALIMDHPMLDAYLDQTHVDDDHPLWIEKYLEYAIETQAEVLCDGNNAHVAAVMEHIELAGVHAGDSACVLPPYSLAPRHLETITDYSQKIAVALETRGLVNLRYAIYRDTVYLLEATCNASRNLSLVAHTHQIPLAGLATELMLGRSLKELSIQPQAPTQIGVRAAVFPFNVFSAEDPLLGPIMRATGQVLAISDTFGLSYFKAQQAATTPLPTQGSVLITVTDEDKPSILEPARIFTELGFTILTTSGTQAFLSENGIESKNVRKLGFGRPNLLDEIKNGGVQMVINTPTGGQGQIDDSLIRKTAIRYQIANITTPASALAAAKGIAAQRS